MAAQKKYSLKRKASSIVKDDLVGYSDNKFRIMNSHEELDLYELKRMAGLSPVQLLTEMRQLINLAYGMHGFDPTDLPKKHSIKIIRSGDEHI
ncbi:MAG: hypothetical protein JNL24_08845 [Bacteroidia bacterium]|nr:hypothetical protein [Bacteroidia bacterium]